MTEESGLVKVRLRVDMPHLHEVAGAVVVVPGYDAALWIRSETAEPYVEPVKKEAKDAQ